MKVNTLPFLCWIFWVLLLCFICSIYNKMKTDFCSRISEARYHDQLAYLLGGTKKFMLPGPDSSEPSAIRSSLSFFLFLILKRITGHLDRGHGSAIYLMREPLPLLGVSEAYVLRSLYARFFFAINNNLKFSFLKGRRDRESLT